MKRVITVIVLAVLSACSSDYAAKKYLNESSESEFLLSIMAFLSKPAPGATLETRCNPEFMTYYQQQLHKFDLVSYKPEADSSFYFLVYKKTPGYNEKYVGIGGKMKMRNGKVVAYEEFFNTPKMDAQDLNEKTEKLFDEMVNSGNVSRYIGNYDWIEYPDSRVVYDRKQMKWRFVWEENAVSVNNEQ